MQLPTWRQFREEVKPYDGPPFVIAAQIDRVCFANTLIDCGCLSYGLISEKFASKHRLERIPIPSRPISGYDGPSGQEINMVARVSIDVGGNQQPYAYFYIVPHIDKYDMILGLPWMKHQKAKIDAKGPRLIFESGITVLGDSQRPKLDIQEVSAAAFMTWKRRKAKGASVEIFSASMKDIEKALRVKPPTDPRTKLPAHYHHHLKLFERQEADRLPPLRGKKVDHCIELIEQDEKGCKPEPPWGPLYNMSRDELLVLRKTLTDYLSKGFIRVSNSPAAAPVLFARKPGGGLRFCCDYRALNRLTKKDRYPLPLIHETLERIGKARWFTKLDVVAAFHKIRIAEGNEWLTAFRTRFGLFEWLVTPFGLANAPSTFQRYINWTLRDYLDEFVSAYLDDILIFSGGTLTEHREHVNKVLRRLEEAGLQLDIDKCEFEVKSTKYLGFIVEAGKGIRMDPEKVKAILAWEIPCSVKGVRSFLGFANFYRRFIHDFSEISAPLTELTKKDMAFQWTAAADQAFTRLKEMFTTAPILTQFDPDRETVVEADSSGWATGGILSQYVDGLLRPCAYFSRKNSPPECNYEIHDKELLAIICCLKEWESELNSVEHFTIITDHKNLRYFTTLRRLNERQMRWADVLSRYSFTLEYRPGKLAARPDALSRREQDMPAANDERLKFREKRLFDPETFSSNVVHASPVRTVVNVATRRMAAKSAKRTSKSSSQNELRQSEQEMDSPTQAPNQPEREEDSQVTDGEWSDQPTNNTPIITDAPSTTNALSPTAEPQVRSPAGPRTEEASLEQQWKSAETSDATLQDLKQAVRDKLPRFPRTLQMKVSMSECKLDEQGRLLYRERRWVPNSEPLRTRLMQETHDSVLCGHPGHNMTYAILARNVYWPGMAHDIRRFTRNCDKCRANVVWRDRRQGLLKPLPIPERKWREISIDFIEKLPISTGCSDMMVIVDRLGKGVIIEPCEKIDTDTVARKLIKVFIGHHGIPEAITSDRGTQFVNAMWERFCELLGIKRRLSTAYHPETDGQTERMNATIEAYIRAFCHWAQGDWAFLCPMAQLAINGRDAASTGISPFFLDHGYHVEPLQLQEEVQEVPHAQAQSMRKKAENIVAKLKGTLDIVQAEMAAAQQRQESLANRHRDEAYEYKVGDKVWLDLRNIRTDRPSKKLDAKHAKFTVLERVGSHAYKLNTPPSIHNVFHTMLLRPAATDPFPSQRNDDYQPPAELIDGEEEWQIDRITGERMVKVGRGYRKEYRVKWTGYSRETWTKAVLLEDTAALDQWEAQHMVSTGGCHIPSSSEVF
jgi:transposase InsO family protein